MGGNDRATRFVIAKPEGGALLQLARGGRVMDQRGKASGENEFDGDFTATTPRTGIDHSRFE